MSHEVLITRDKAFFDFFANPDRGGPQHPVPDSTGLMRLASAWICKKLRMLCLLVIRASWDI